MAGEWTGLERARKREISELKSVPARKDGMAAPQPCPTRSSRNADGLICMNDQTCNKYCKNPANAVYLDAHALAEVAGNARANIARAGAHHKGIDVSSNKARLHKI